MVRNLYLKRRVKFQSKSFRKKNMMSNFLICNIKTFGHTTMIVLLFHANAHN
jgi:hypothetical protein